MLKFVEIDPAQPHEFTSIASPIGDLTVVAAGEVLTGLYMTDQALPFTPAHEWSRAKAAGKAAREQLDAYFDGGLTEFDLELSVTGTAFQESVWRELAHIPYARTISYGELAESVGKPGASRAVGTANGRNRISVIIPCHRVIAAGGKLGGYGGGLERKQQLLDLEARTAGLVLS